MRNSLIFSVFYLMACGGSKAPDTATGLDAVDAVDIAAEATATVDPCAADLALANPPTPTLATPRWAFEPWISKDISTADDTRAFVQGFIDRQIPIGVVVLDSPWETNYQTFQANPSRYPELPKLVDEMHGKNVKVVVWLTSLVNDSSFDLEIGGDTYDGPSPNFAEGKACGHFVDGAETYSWWKGTGAGLDFFSAAARTWWNRQQIDLLQIVDGYKLDFGEMYIGQVPMTTAQGLKSLDDYSQAYYHQMLAFGVAQKGAGNFVTMVRPWDESYQFPGRFFANKQDAPVAWVGDNRRDWVGLVDALNEMFISAQAGYTMLGSDVGGYLDRDDKSLLTLVPYDAVTFARWIAVGGLGPFMELHGRANLTPWTVPDHADEITAAYKYWASWHHQFAPMLFSEVRRSQAGQGPVVMQPVGQPADWPGDWRYTLGQRWLVAPLTDATGKRDVKLPAGKDWLDWWQLSAAPLPGGTTVTVDYSGDLTKTPLYLDACSVQPFVDGDALTGLTNTPHPAQNEGWLVAFTSGTCPDQTFERLDADGTQVTAKAWYDAGLVVVRLSARPNPTLLTLRLPAAPTGVASADNPAIAFVVQDGLVYVTLPSGGPTTLTFLF